MRLMVFVGLLLSINTFAHNPITDFGWHTYLGEGYFRQGDQEGNYIAEVKTAGNGWDETIVYDGVPRFYHYHFDFTDDGFFNVSLSTHVSDDELLTFEGHGYCMSVQCSYFAEHDGSFIEEHITLLPEENAAYKMGSAHRLLEDGSYEVYTWEAGYTLIDHYHDDDKN